MPAFRDCECAYSLVPSTEWQILHSWPQVQHPHSPQRRPHPWHQLHSRAQTHPGQTTRHGGSWLVPLSFLSSNWDNLFSIFPQWTVMSHTNIPLLSLSVAAPALRTPLSIAGSYPTPFAMMGHHEMNGGLTSPGVYAGLHISPQMSAAAAAAYGRSPMVTAFAFFAQQYLTKSTAHSKKNSLTFWETLIHFLAEKWKDRCFSVC